eukprot:3933610-Rhodomonas_salina.4
MDTLTKLFGNTYTSMYWCLFPPSQQEHVVPRLQDCQDSLQDRLGKLQQRHVELSTEMKTLKNCRDRTKLRRMFLEYKSITKDIGVTENTLWLVDRQLQLFERSTLDSLVIDTLHSSCSALNGIALEVPGVQTVEELTDTLQNRMQEINDVNDSMSVALQRGLDDDLSTLEKDLNDFLELDDAPDSIDSVQMHSVQQTQPKQLQMPSVPFNPVAAATQRTQPTATQKTLAMTTASGMQELDSDDEDNFN